VLHALTGNQYYHHHGIFAITPEDSTPNKKGDIVGCGWDVEPRYQITGVPEQ
jgi:hypothetical protein